MGNEGPNIPIGCWEIDWHVMEIQVLTWVIFDAFPYLRDRDLRYFMYILRKILLSPKESQIWLAYFLTLKNSADMLHFDFFSLNK